MNFKNYTDQSLLAVWQSIEQQWPGMPSAEVLHAVWIAARSALRSKRGTARRSRPLRYKRSKATITIFVDRLFNSF